MDAWEDLKTTLAGLFRNQRVAEHITLRFPVAEYDWSYDATLADKTLLFVVEGKHIIRESDKTVWLYLDEYEARRMAALLLAYADATEIKYDGRQ